MNPRVCPCEPLCGRLRGGAASLPGEGFQAAFGRICGGFLSSAEDKTGLPPKPSEAGSVGRGEAAE